MTINKLKIYLSGNNESNIIRNNVRVFLEKKYRNIIEFNNDNYVINFLKICKVIAANYHDSIAFFFCNDANNINSIVDYFPSIKKVIVSKTNKNDLKTLINANIVIFSLNIFDSNEIISIINNFLIILNKKSLFY